MLGLVFVLGYLFVFLLILLSVGVAILRGAIGLTNLVFGGRIPRECDYELDVNSWSTRLKNPNGFVIGVPNFGIAAAVILIPTFVNFMIVAVAATSFYGFAFIKNGTDGVLRVAKELPYNPVMQGLIPVCFLVRVGLVGGLLRTTFVKGFVIVVMETLIALFLAAGLYLILVAAGEVATPSWLAGVF